MDPWADTPRRITRRLNKWRALRAGGSLPTKLGGPASPPIFFSSHKPTRDKSNITSPSKLPGVLKAKRRLFREPAKQTRVVFMNATKGFSSTPPAGTKGLPRGTWVGLRCPWNPTDCPLCELRCDSLAKAAAHYKKRHAALKTLYLCAKCGSAGTSAISLASHATRCGTKKRPLVGARNCLCEYCPRGFQTSRGLSQHVRWAHIGVYMAKLTGEKRPKSPAKANHPEVQAEVKSKLLATPDALPPAPTTTAQSWTAKSHTPLPTPR